MKYEGPDADQRMVRFLILAIELEQGFRHTLELDRADGIELLTLPIASLDCREGFEGK
jgi:hypothetical protein